MAVQIMKSAAATTATSSSPGTRQLKLRNFCNATPKSKEGIQVGNIRSNFVPNITDLMIVAFERVVQRDIRLLEHSKMRQWNNLHWQEKKVLEALAQDTSIIKEADRGGGIVILDRDIYLGDVNRQLSDVRIISPFRMIP